MRLVLVAIAVGLIAGLALCVGEVVPERHSASQPSASEPVLSSGSSDSWTVLVTCYSTSEEDKTRTIFLATVTNSGEKAQVLFTPGLVGPALYPKAPKGEPLETHVPPRKGPASSQDFLELRPGEGFSRSFVLNQGVEELKPPLAAVGAKLILYEKGAEGHSGKVKSVVQAVPLKIKLPNR